MGVCIMLLDSSNPLPRPHDTSYMEQDVLEKGGVSETWTGEHLLSITDVHYLTIFTDAEISDSGLLKTW